MPKSPESDLVIGDFHDELTTFSEFGSATHVDTKIIGSYTVPIYENEFWTAKQRDGHSVHQVSYRACYKPQLPGFFIDRFCEPNDLVYDPFMGRGTTLIEAQLKGCRAMGNDANPLSTILAAPRLAPPTLPEVAERLAETSLDGTEKVDSNLLVYFHPDTLAELYGWRSYFKKRQKSGRFDTVDAWIQMVACNRLTGHSSGFFSVYTLPPNQATSLESQRRINEKRQQTADYRDTKALILKKSKQLLKDPFPDGYLADGYLEKDAQILCSSADQTSKIPSQSVKLVVTSPPFLDIVDYVGDNWLRNWFCEVDLDPKMIWQMKSLDDWSAKMAGVLEELKRVLKPDGLIAFEVGEVRHGKVRLEDQVIEAGLAAGLRPECVLINSQNFTKTANCWGVSNNAKGTNSNRIVVFKRG